MLDSKFKITVWIIDDSVEDATLIQLLISKIPHMDITIVNSFTYADAIAKKYSSDIDVILIDYILEDHTGVQLGVELENNGWQQPKVLQTGFGSEKVVAEALRSGFSDYLPKSEISESVLEKTLRMVVEKNKAEEKIQKLNRELEQKVIDRTALLDIVNKELSLFMYSISHDLQSPLRQIIGFNRLLIDQLGDAYEGRVKEYLDDVNGSTEYMLKLLTGLLSYSHLGKEPIELKPVQLNDFLSLIYEHQKVMYNHKSLKIILDDFPPLVSDEKLLQQVFTNLIDNALKFSEHKENAKISILLEKLDENEYVISIKDNGVGFNMKYQKNLFTIFKRLHRMDEFTGVGIGLASVKRIMDRFGGKVWVESEQNKGTAFYLSFPIKNRARK